MQKAIRLTATQRNRALGRLRTFTVGTALASVAATGAFGYLAVVTNPGTQAKPDTATTTTTAVTGSTSSSSSTSSSATASPKATPGLQSSTSAATTTTRRAHVTTGGS